MRRLQADVDWPGVFLTRQQPPEQSIPAQPIANQANRLHRVLSSFGVLLLTLSCLSPVYSIYGIGSDILLHVGTGAAIVFISGIGVAVVWAVVYAELASAYPYAGGDYVGVGAILGPWAGFASLTVWAVTAGPANAFLAKTIATYVGELVPTVSPLLVTFVALGAAIAVALLAVRTSALVTGVIPRYRNASRACTHRCRATAPGSRPCRSRASSCCTWQQREPSLSRDWRDGAGGRQRCIRNQWR